MDRAAAADQRVGRRVDRDQDRAAGRDQRFAGNASTHLVILSELTPKNVGLNYLSYSERHDNKGS